LDLRVEVNRVEYAHLRVELGEPVDGLADALESAAEGLATMTGDKDPRAA
jgi:hypothetical protein